MQRFAEPPRTRAPDSTLALLREGYAFIGNRCRRHRTEVFRTRLMLRDVLCMTGGAAAELFYGGARFEREGAMPVSALKLLQDRGSVQLMEDEAHSHRKRLFLSLMTPESLRRLRELTVRCWERRARSWQDAPQVTLVDEARRILTDAVCVWAGIELHDNGVERRARELVAMIEGAGSIGPSNWRALLLRRRSERWARDLIRNRRGRPEPAEPGSALDAVAWHRDPKGRLLGAEVAAVELLNLLRPTVAVANYIVFAALALHRHPRWRDRFAAGEEDDLENFVHEVRRLSPFFPFIGGRARETIDWRGLRIGRGQWVLLDLYGTCRDARCWDEPEQFRPERFRDRGPGAFDLIPQGGGEHLSGHRCPGEWITVELVKESVRLLTRAMRYEVPEQDLSVDLSRIPALPASGMILDNPRWPG